MLVKMLCLSANDVSKDRRSYEFDAVDPPTVKVRVAVIVTGPPQPPWKKDVTYQFDLGEA